MAHSRAVKNWDTKCAKGHAPPVKVCLSITVDLEVSCCKIFVPYYFVQNIFMVWGFP